MYLRNTFIFFFSLTLSILFNSAVITTPIATAQSIRPELRSGSTGSVVQELQATLRLLGYYSGEMTGTYDEATVIAVYRFQRAAQIPGTGIMDQTTWTTLFPISASNPTTITPPQTAPPETTPPQQTSPNEQVTSLELDKLPILREGAEGESVKLLQRRLKGLNYYNGVVDGVFGRQTLLAVIAAQKALKLDADGIVGYQTWEKLLTN
ncbi:MAG: peptidoglycan-binding protein [Limnothrix sp.]